jgi:hypothetical protein
MADLELVAELAEADHHLAVVATARPDGSVHASLVMAGLIDDPETGAPCVGLVVAGAARKLVHLGASGRATVVFKAGYRWVAVEGPVRLEGYDHEVPGSGRDPATLLRSVFVAAGGTHDDWDEFDRTMAEERRCAVFVRAEQVSSNG